MPLGQRGQVRPADGREWQTVLIRDLSEDGVGFQADTAMVKGRPLVLRMTGRGGAVVDLPCGVRWCEPGGFMHAGFDVGAALVGGPPAQGEGPTRPAWVNDLLVAGLLRRAMGRGG